MDTYSQTNNEYRKLLKLFFNVGDSLRGLQLESHRKWLYFSDPLIAKLFNHLGSLHYLFLRTNLSLPGDRPRYYIDHASISVIARAAFETYLTFYYIFCDPTSTIEEKQFRNIVWRISGLQDRQTFIIVRNENIPKLKEEKKVLKSLLLETKRSAYYRSLNSKSKEAALKGLWRYRKGWVDLAGVAGFNRDVFRNVYSYLCSYAHSGSLSATQIGDAVSISDQQSLAIPSSHYGLILMSHFVFTFCELFPEAKNSLEDNNELKQLAEKWHVTW